MDTLSYALDGYAEGMSALLDDDVAVTRESSPLVDAWSPSPARVVVPAIRNRFQPERISGLCAGG